MSSAGRFKSSVFLWLGPRASTSDDRLKINVALLCTSGIILLDICYLEEVTKVECLRVAGSMTECLL